jgi:hypothetical protein
MAAIRPVHFQRLVGVFEEDGFASTDMGTLDEILREAGYEPEGEGWRAPEFVSVDRLTMSMK